MSARPVQIAPAAARTCALQPRCATIAARCPAAARKAPQNEYTCPMDPEVRQQGPGDCPKCGMALEPARCRAARDQDRIHLPDASGNCAGRAGDCPICGMALEPRTVSVEEEKNPELVEHDAAVLDLRGAHDSVLLVAMADLVPGLVVADAVRCRRGPGSGSNLSWRRRWCCGAAGRFLCAAWRSLVTRNLNMFTLIGLGVGRRVRVQRRGRAVSRNISGIVSRRGREVAVYFEAAAAITTLVLLGQVMELRARSRTGAAIKALLGLAPKTARLIREDGSEVDVPLDRSEARRPAARAPRRKNSRGWRGPRRREQRGRIDDQRRADSRRKSRRARA